MCKMTEFFRWQVSARPFSPVEMNPHQQHLEILPQSPVLSPPTLPGSCLLLPSTSGGKPSRSTVKNNNNKKKNKRKRQFVLHGRQFSHFLFLESFWFLHFVSSSLTFLNKIGQCSMFVHTQWWWDFERGAGRKENRRGESKKTSGKTEKGAGRGGADLGMER